MSFEGKNHEMWCYCNIMRRNQATIRDVAKVAGVSVMTVSRSLRDEPKVAAETRARVLKAAQDLCYRPDPHLARMMKLVRSKKHISIRAVIAVIREEVSDDQFRSQPYQFVPLEAIRSRALGHGYEVEEFWLGRDGLTPKRLQKILYARGIEAVIVSPQSAKLPCSQLDYSSFATAAFGYALNDSTMDLSATNMNLGIQIAASELRRRGYRRIGVAITRWIDERVQRGYSSGFFQFQNDIPHADHVPMLFLPDKHLARGFNVFSEWYQQHKPDAIISFDTFVPKWLLRLKLKTPDDIGFVVHDLTSEMTGFAGMNHRRDQLAASAIDLVVMQLSQHQDMPISVPRQILISPEWIDGPSVRSVEGE